MMSSLSHQSDMPNKGRCVHTQAISHADAGRKSSLARISEQIARHRLLVERRMRRPRKERVVRQSTNKKTEGKSLASKGRDGGNNMEGRPSSHSNEKY